MPEIDEYIIDLSAVEEPVELEIPEDEPITLEMISGDVIITEGIRVYSHTLSQVDIDNKFVAISGLSVLTDKSKSMVLLDNTSIHLEYGADYTINNENKIIWNGYALDGLIKVGDKLKVYY